MAHIIGLDLGNSYSFPSYIPEFDPSVSRLGGKPVDLLPHDKNYGFPSVFFYSKIAADRSKERRTPPPPWCGTEAVSGRATPAGMRVKNLKRHMGQNLELDDWNGSYDEAITALIQYLVRQANVVLHRETLETSNLVSLAYPVTFTRAQCAHLKMLAERATLEDGTNVVVSGMIAEPAAAALDYLAQNGQTDRDTTVMTYDLGGGTFDCAILSLYPNGRKAPSDGESEVVYYYDIEAQGGIGNIGGTEYDKALTALIKEKLNGQNVPEDTLNMLTVNAKHELSDYDDTSIEIISTTGEQLSITISREEFERVTSHLTEATVEELARMLSEYSGDKPSIIVLTGGAAQMPQISKCIERALPEYEDKIVLFRPSRAISYGAARYGSCESHRSDPHIHAVRQRTSRDLGILFITDGNEDSISTYIPAGSPLPFRSEDIRSCTRFDGQRGSIFTVYEAKGSRPDNLMPKKDYSSIMSVSLSYDDCPKGTEHLSRLILDQNGLLTVEAWDPQNPDSTVRNECTLIIDTDAEEGNQ